MSEHSEVTGPLAKLAGCDLVITELTFGGKFTPLNFQIVMPDERPEI